MRIRNEQKEAAIREKAMEMIVAEGFDGLSMQKLARAACVSPATIYIYFKNREDLLNQLFNEVQEKFSEVALKDFTPELSFKDGLWLQWKNRLEFIDKYPVHYNFYEQFRNSPLVNHEAVRLNYFKENMQLFLKNSISRGEIEKMEPEVFWSVAYGTFYSLVKFHLHEKTLTDKSFKITDSILKQTFDMVLRAFKP
ncbi:MAG TPA: TetR/AcrR family transcriptional regulator [Patescibacteria group bacterium]|nr:TetR/AcrR family transcriptional regulator [Patescibacteria group bacterium]